MKRGQKYYARKAEDLVLLLAKRYQTPPHRPIPKKEVVDILGITDEMLISRVMRSVPYDKTYYVWEGQALAPISPCVSLANEIRRHRRQRRSVRIIIGLTIIAALGAIFSVLQYVRGCSSL